MRSNVQQCAQTIMHGPWARPFHDVICSNDTIMTCCTVLRSYDAISWIYLIGQLPSCIVLTPKHVHTSPFVYKPCGIEGQSSDCPLRVLYDLADFTPYIIRIDSPLPAIISLTFALVSLAITTLSSATMEDLAIAALIVWQFIFCAVMILYLQTIFLHIR